MRAPTLTSATVALRAYRPEERDRFVALMTHPDVMRHVDGPLSPERAAQLFEAHIGRDPSYERLFLGWAAELAETHEYVGGASLLRNREESALELGYLLMPQHWGRGLATTIATLVLDHAHGALGVDRVVATVDLENAASIRVLEKSGMEFFRRAHDDRGEYFVYESRRTHDA